MNQSTHPIVANSTSSMVLSGPFRNGLLFDTASVLNNPIVLSANALSYASRHSGSMQQSPRNAATRDGKLEYRTSVAQWKADLAARRPKVAKLVEHEPLREYVQEVLSGVIRDENGEV